MKRLTNISNLSTHYKNTTFVFKESFTWKRESFTFTWIYNPLQIERISATRRKAIQDKIKHQNRREKWKNYFFLFIVTPIVLAFLYNSLKDFRFGFRSLTNTIDSEVISSKKRVEKFQFYLNDGDAWLSNKHYYNAVFQYRKAYKLYPKNYHAKYRLIMGLAYQCQYELRGCTEGKELALQFAEQYPDEEEIHDLLILFP